MKAKGFTLLEVMIALAVVGGLLITVIYTLNHNLGIAQRQESETVLIMLAREKMAELRESPARGEGEFQGEYSGYKYAASAVDSVYPGVTELSVTVSVDKEKVTLRELYRNRQ